MKFTYWLGYSFFKLTAKLLFRYRVIGRENLDVSGGCLIAANHASFLDPPMVGIAYDDAITYLGRKTLMNSSVGKWLLPRWNTIPIDQERPEISSLRKVIQVLKDGGRLLIFPEGQRTWDGQLGPGQPGVGLIVMKSRVPVLPVRLFGTYEALPRGSSRLSRSPITLVVGEPIDMNAFIEESGLKGKELNARISEKIMEEIAALKLPEEKES